MMTETELKKFNCFKSLETIISAKTKQPLTYINISIPRQIASSVASLLPADHYYPSSEHSKPTITITALYTDVVAYKFGMGETIRKYDWDEIMTKITDYIRQAKEILKMCNGLSVVQLYSFKGNGVLDCAQISTHVDPFCKIPYTTYTINFGTKVVSAAHGYPGAGKAMAKKLGFEYHNLY